MEVYACGFVGHQGGYFISCEHIGSDNWLAYIVGIPNGRVFSPNAKGFH
jgi:hypothetical protein